MYSQKGSALVIIPLVLVLMGASVAGTYYAISNKLISLPGLSEPAKVTQVLPTPVATPKETKLQGVLALKEGSIAVSKNGAWEELKKGATIKEGDVVRTGYRSRGVIELDDGSAVRLDQQTEVAFSNLSGEVIVLQQNNGRIYNRVHPGKLVYNVKSLNTVATALGTSFSVATNAKQQTTEVAVYESKVALASSGQEGVKTQVAIGEMAVVGKDEKPAVEKITEGQKKEAFIAWNQTLDKEPTPAPTVIASPKPVVSEAPKEIVRPASNTTLNLTAEARSGGALIRWTGDSSNGFKACYSERENPAYPADNCTYKNASDRSFEIGGLTGGKTYHFRVGVYGTDGKVSTYSNDVTVTPSGSVSSNSSGQVKSISINVEKQDGGKAKVTWNIDGSSPLGFKVVWGPNSGPTYPTREGDKYHYYSESGKRDDIIEGLSGKTYYFRVCEYLGGKCGVYSNEVSLSY